MSNKKVKITIDVIVNENEAVFFGIPFVASGAKGKQKYIAEVEQTLAKSLLDANKVSIVK